jgi:hypothetical protein
MRRDPSLVNGFRWGMIYGLGLATVFSLFIGGLALRRGSDWNPTYQVSTWAVVRGYYIAGMVGGLAFACLRPLLWGRVGGVVLGMLVGPAVYCAVAFAVDGPYFESGAAILAGVLVGGAVGWQWSKPGALG